jgi:hypothetical protein
VGEIGLGAAPAQALAEGGEEAGARVVGDAGEALEALVEGAAVVGEGPHLGDEAVLPTPGLVDEGIDGLVGARQGGGIAHVVDR